MKMYVENYIIENKEVIFKDDEKDIEFVVSEKDGEIVVRLLNLDSELVVKPSSANEIRITQEKLNP